MSFLDEKSATFQLLGLTFDWPIVISTVVAALIVFFLVFFLSRSLTMKPGKKQNVLEAIVDFTDGIVDSSLPSSIGNELKLTAFTLFLFIFVSNEMGLAVQVAFGDVTYVKSPTTNPVVTMGLALLVVGLANFVGVSKLGFKGYFKTTFMSPMAFLLPINIFEQFTNYLTLALRLYGNIMAGEMLLTLITNWGNPSHLGLTIVPAFFLSMLWQAFSLFIGAIQAFIFVTLMSIYTSEHAVAE